MNDNDRLLTESQDLNIEIESTQSQNIDNRRSSTIIQDENIEAVSTLSQYSDEPLPINSKRGEIVLSDKMLYTSDNGYLKLELKKEDRINIKSGEAILFKNKVPTNSDKKVEVIIKVFKNIDIHSDAKKLENRKNILKLLYENRKETEKNNLASVISYGKVIIGDKEYFAEVYRYYSGGDLLNKAPLKYEEIKQRIIPSLLTALRYLHSHNIVHRDIKPENIYIDANGRIYLGDFGIARYIGENNKEYDNKKFGTPGYSALELLAPSTGIVGKESDYYSLGQTLFTLYTGKMMYDSIIKGDDRNQTLIEYMLYDNYIELDRLKNHKLFQALVKGLLNSSPKNRFNDTHIDKFLIEDYSLIREAKLNKKDDFNLPLNVFGKSFYSKNEIFNFLIENKDRVNEFFNNQYISRTLDKNNIPIDCKKIEKIEKEYINGDIFEKKYQLFNLYKYLKNENIFIWDNKEIKDYREITSIPSDDLKKLLQKEEMYDFFKQKFNFDDKVIAIFQDIRKYYPEKIVSILNILFDPNNNNKREEEYTYQGKNLETLIIECIQNENFNILVKGIFRNGITNIVVLSALLYFKGYPKLNPIEFFIALEENVKENEVKIKIRKKFLEYNIDNLNETNQKLIEMISSIRNKYYEATGRESQEILDNICSCEIFIERMNINEIIKSINNFEYEYKRFERKFEDNPYSVIKKSYPKDSIITRYYNKYITKNINEYYNKFKTEISTKKAKFDELKTSQKKENIMSLFLVSIISFLLAYILSMKDLYIKYIAIDNSIIKLLIPEFKYLFYAIGTYFIVKVIIFIILKLSINYKDIEKKCTDIFNKTYGSQIADFIYTGICEKKDSKFIEDYSEVDTELNKLEEKYINTNNTYEKVKKIQFFLPAFSMMLVLFLIFKNVNIFDNEYFLFKLYGYFLSLAIIYVLAIDKYLKTFFYSKNIFLVLSLIFTVGLYLYKYIAEYSIIYGLNIFETLKLHKAVLIASVLLILLINNIKDTIENVNSYLFYILLIPGILIPLSFLTLSNENLKWYYFYILIAIPGLIGFIFNRAKPIVGYLMYKIPFALLGYSLIMMSGTPMFRLTGFFNGFVMLIMGDIFAGIVLLIIIGIIGSIL
ncbi:protein kinase domain-containing protein [Fusobacterium animalis]|uniref:protein kinase domain-containing protein n=1 Tax=Fusobacterium animalis TaxID=76859 RepID=UPI0034E0185E